MAIIGQAIYTVSADTSPAQKGLTDLERRFLDLGGVLTDQGKKIETGLIVPISKAQRELEALGAQFTQTGKLAVASFGNLNLVTGHVDRLVRELRTLNEIGSRTRHALSLSQAQREAEELGVILQERVVKSLRDVEKAAARLPSLLTKVAQPAQFRAADEFDEENNLVGRKGEALPTQFTEQRIRQLDTVKQSATILEQELLKAAVGGKNLDEVLLRISRRAGEIDSLARIFDRLPGDAPRNEIARLDAEMEQLIGRSTEVTEALREAAKTPPGREVQGQFQLGVGIPVVDDSSVQRMERLGQAVAEVGKKFRVADAAAEDFTQLDFGSLAQEEQTAAAATDRLTKEVHELDRKFIELTTLTKRGVVDPRIGQQMQVLEARAQQLGIKLGVTRKELEKMGQGGGGKIATFLRNMSGSFDRFGQSIEEATGIAESDFAILLGAGLAGGFAGVIRITQKVVTAVAQLVDEFKKLDRQTELTFRGSAEFVRSFAEGATGALGVSRREALETANAFATLGRQLQLSEDSLLDFSIDMTRVTGIVEQAVPGFNDTASAQEAIASAIKGSNDALFALGVTIQQLNEIAKETFGRSFDQLSEFEQAAIRALAIEETAGQALLRTGERTASIGDHIKNVKDAFADLFDTTELEQFNMALKQLEGFNENFLEQILGLGTSTDAFKEKIRGLSEESLLSLRALADQIITDKDNRIAAKTAIDEQLKALRDQAAERDKAKLSEEEILEIQKRSLQTFKDRVDLQRQAADAVRNLREAEFDGTRRVIEAELRLTRVREDNVRKLRDLNIQSARSIEDTVTRVTAAELELQDNQNDAQDRIEDANDRLADARKEAYRSVRDINERIADLELDHARKVEDARERIADAHKNAAKDVTEAEIAMQEALRAGDAAAFNAAARQVSGSRTQSVEELARIEKNLAEEQEDFEREVARLRRDRDEARLDGIEDIQRAERDRARAERDNLVLIAKAQLQLDQAIREEVRAREDAIRALNDLEVEQNRALRDARHAVEEAEIARDRAIASALRAFERLAEQLGLVFLGLDGIEKLLVRLGMIPPENPFIGPISFRQAGGPVSSFEPYIVGETGPELFVPGRHGNVISNEQLVQLLNSVTGKGPSPTFNVYESVDPRTTAFAISRYLASQVKN